MRKMRAQSAPAHLTPRSPEPDVASAGHSPGTPIDDDMIFEDALHDPRQEVQQPEQPEVVRNEDLPPVAEEFESASEEMGDQPPQQDQPAASAAASSQPPEQPETFAQRRRRMDLHETDFLRHPAFKHKSDDQLQANNPKRQKSTQEQAFSIDVFILEDKSSSDGMQTWRPSGWTYDAKLNEFQLGETQDF